MKLSPQDVGSTVGSAAAFLKRHKGWTATLAVLLIFQLYFVRELLAAEVLFGIGFAVLFAIGLAFYLIGAIGERAFDAAEASARMVAHTAHEGYVRIEEISKKPFRHPRSSSAQ